MSQQTYLAVLLVLAIGCTSMPETNPSEVMAADRAFSSRSAAEGVRAAFVAYAAEDVIKPESGHQPILGRDALIRFYESADTTATLTWEPVRAERSGDLAWTFGNWIRVQNADTLHGNYVTIWRKQPDGSWKFVLDTGNATE